MRAREGSEPSLVPPDAAVLGGHLRVPAGTREVLGGYVGISGLSGTGAQSQMCIADFLFLLGVLEDRQY